MDNKIKIAIAVIVLIILIVICFVTFKDKENEPTNSNTVENVTNTIENTVQNIVKNEIENEVIQNVIENKATKTPIVENQKLDTEDFSTSVYEDKTETGTLSKKQEAINLVKEQWGEDDTVTFSCDSITSDGIYIIAVTSKERAVVLNYFRVNLATKSVTVDY